MKFNLENFLELDTTQLLAVKTSSGGGSDGGSCSGINTGISIINGYDLPSISNKGKKQPVVSIGSEGLTITPKKGVGITVDVDVTGGYTPGNESFGIDVHQGTVEVKTPIGTFSGELESVTVKVKVDY